MAKTPRTCSHEPSRPIQEKATTFAGIKTGGFHPVTERTAKVAARSEFTILALCFAAHEKHLDRTAWRNPTADTREYFAQVVM